MHKTCLPLHSGTADDKIINDVELKNVPFSYMEILVAVQEECHVPCAVCNDLAASAARLDTKLLRWMHGRSKHGECIEVSRPWP